MNGSEQRRAPGPGSLDGAFPASVDEWIDDLAGHGEIGALLCPTDEEQLGRGYGHTLREICQQPVTWVETAALVLGWVGELRESLSGMEAVVLTGSGSSQFAAECVAPCLQGTLRVPVTAIPAGQILTHPDICLPPSGPYLVVSLARSGNSPESRAVVDWLLETQPRARHLFLTCNRQGTLAQSYRDVPSVRSLVLDEKTDDKSLVMTSSFTNLVLAARGLGVARNGEDCLGRARAVARAAVTVLRHRADAISTVARSGFGSVVYLGSGCRMGSAREAALKMLEMNAGQIWTMSESYLGLRHGPMSAIRHDTMVVALLSSDPVVRAYELDLVRELALKELGASRLLVGGDVPRDLATRASDVVIDCGASPVLGDEDLTMIDALVGQLLAFFRCVSAGLRPDSPSAEGVITRVVSDFAIHRPNGAR